MAIVFKGKFSSDPTQWTVSRMLDDDFREACLKLYGSIETERSNEDVGGLRKINKEYGRSSVAGVSGDREYECKSVANVSNKESRHLQGLLGNVPDYERRARQRESRMTTKQKTRIWTHISGWCIADWRLNSAWPAFNLTCVQ